MSLDDDMDRALAALEKEAASKNPNWHSIGTDEDQDMEAEMAREEAKLQQLLANPMKPLEHIGDEEALMEEADGGPHGSAAIADDDVLGELADLENEVHQEGGSHPSIDHDNDDVDMNEDDLLAAAEAEAEQLAREESKQTGTNQQRPTQPKTASSTTTTSSAPTPPARPPKPNQQLTSAGSALNQPTPTPVPAASSASVESIPALQARLLTLKQKAVELNRAGKKSEAMDVMRNCKAVQAKIAELQTKAATPATTPKSSNSQTKPPPNSTTTPNTRTTSTTSTAAAPPAPPRPVMHIATTPAASSSSTITTYSSSSSSKLGMRAQLEYDTLISQLDAQIASLAASMKSLVAEGSGGVGVKPGSREAKLLALQYFRAKSRSQKDRDVLALAKQRGLKPPQTHTEELVIQQELSFPELTDDQIEICVQSGKELHNPRVVSSPNDLVPMVSVSMEFAMDMEGTMKSSAAQVTPASKGPNPTWNHSIKFPFPFTRTNPKDKFAVKKLLRSRIVIVLQHKRFLLGPNEVARGEIKLKELQTKCELIHSLKLKDSSGGRCGELELRVRMRKPFEGMDLRQTKQMILVVDEFEEEPPETQSAPPVQTPTPVVATQPITTPASSEVIPTPISSTSTSTPISAPTPVAAAAASSIDLSNPHAINKMRSNDVLEAEIERIKQEMITLKSQPSKTDLDEHGVSATATRLDELSDRLTAAQVQLEVLVTRVQNGKLTLADYLTQLKADILSETQLALALAKSNKKPDAALVVERVKLMKAEVANAEENQEELEKC